MKKKRIGVVLTTAMLISVFVVIASTMSAMQANDADTTTTSENLEKIQKAIEEKGAKWTADETSVSGLSIEEKKMLCGAKIGPIPRDAIEISPPEVSMPIGTFDWRNKNGQNWMTPVKSQGPCGSCWIFGSTSAFEAQINIDAGDPTIDFDSSEQHILSCSGGGDCDGGSPFLALAYIRDSGVPDERCFPYQADDTIPCGNTCPDWHGRACTCEWIGVPTSHTTESYKAILQEYGPMVVVLNVSEDLFYYTGGIYEPVWTSEEFGWANHCVTLVGYNDTGGYWIIKNSWGPGWGEGGYGGVYYGNLEQYEYAFVVVNTSCPLVGKPDLVVKKSLTTEYGTFIVNYTVTNIGDGPAGESHVCKLINGTVAKKVAVPPLGPGENYRGTFDPEPCPCGQTLNVTVCADCQNEVAESDETNNCEVNVVECPRLPDLVIEKIWTKERRDRCKVYFVVKNIGCVPAPGGHYATLLVNGKAEEEKRVRRDLGPGEEYESSFRTYVSCTGDDIRVCADNFNVIDELDETNNCLPPIVEKPDLVIEDKWEKWVNETHYSVTYVMHNKGPVKAPGGHRTTLIVDGVAIEHKIMPDDLEYCETYTDTFDTVIECTDDFDTIKVCADSDEIIDEINEDNNCLENEWICDEVVEKPDLIIEDIWTRERRGECRVYFVVKNDGAATAPRGHKATLFVNGEPVEEGRAVRKALGPGDEYKGSFRTRVNCADAIKACADNTNIVDESDETNNCREV